MMTSRKLLVALLCPLFVMGSLLLIQGCGGGGETEEAAETATEEAAETATEEAAETATEEAAETATEEAAAPADEMKQELESHTADLALTGYCCSMHPEQCSLEPGKCGTCGMDMKKAGVHYTCTTCEDVSENKPGACPHCAMALVLRPVTEKKEAESAH